MPAKNIVQCVRGGQVIWAASPTRFGERACGERERAAGSLNKTEFVFETLSEAFGCDLLRRKSKETYG